MLKILRNITALLLSLSLTPMCLFVNADTNGDYLDALSEIQESDAYWLSASIEAATGSLELSAKAAILMDCETGEVLYEHNPDLKLPPASVTKIMTLLLVAEAVDRGDISLTDTVTASREAAGMGGSQIYLKENEEMTVDELLKAAFVASANDASYALAEFVAGSESAFVSLMNKRAAELNMTGTLFKNTTGLPGEEHYSTARDIAIMSRELLKHEFIFEYTTIWMDYLRDGATQLVNTNKLIKRYKGAPGLKTGSTDEAGSCISASAQRDGLSLIAVVLGAPSSAERFDDAKKLLDYGFLNFVSFTPTLPESISPYPVEGGESLTAEGETGKAPKLLLMKGEENRVKVILKEPVTLTAPIKKGDKIGEIEITLDGEILALVPVTSKQDIKPLTWWFVFSKMIASFFTL